MDDKTIKQLLEINANFYESYAKEFSVTRQAPWQGWFKLLALLPKKKIRILDLGCGNGRFYKFLKSEYCGEIEYFGVDSSKGLIDEAKSNFAEANFEVGDFLEKNGRWFGGSLDSGGTHLGDFGVAAGFDVVAAFGVMHHIPSEKLRIQFISDMVEQLSDGGLLVLTFWTKQPQEVNCKVDTGVVLEESDFIVRWGREERKFRYLHTFDQKELEQVKRSALKLGLELISEFSSDGKSGDSNVYLVWRKI